MAIRPLFTRHNKNLDLFPAEYHPRSVVNYSNFMILQFPYVN